MSGTQLDRAGRPVSPSEWRRGRAPANKGKRQSPNPPSSASILGAVASLPDDPQGRRLAALVAVLWRGGLGLSEALALQPDDLDAEHGVVVVRAARKAARRRAAMDAWGFERVTRWREVRDDLPAGPLFCILRGPTAGQDWGKCGARAEIRRLGAATGVKQLAPQQLRYAHAVELLAKGVSPREAYRQLGLSTARNNRAPALVTLANGRLASEALKPPGGEKALRQLRDAPSGDAYALVRRAAQAADAGYRAASSRTAKRAWNEALTALHRAEEKIMHASAEDYGAAA